MSSYSEPLELADGRHVRARARRRVRRCQKKHVFPVFGRARDLRVQPPPPRPEPFCHCRCCRSHNPGCGLWAAMSTRNWRIDTTALYQAFAPVVRIELLIVYFFVVFHKMNSGFFDPEHSCGSFMYLRLAHEYPLLPTGDWFRPWAIYLTMIAETAIPVMLVVRALAAGRPASGIRVSFRACDGSRRRGVQLLGDSPRVLLPVSTRRVRVFPRDYARRAAGRVAGALHVSPAVVKGLALAVAVPLFPL